jgi:hypothetical protein
MIKVLLYSVLIFSLLNCSSDSEEQSTIKKFQGLVLDSVKYIIIEQGKASYKIKGLDSVLSFVKKINDSRVHYIKFGSPDKFYLYNNDDKMIFSGLFRGAFFKSNGIVFKAETNLMEWK